MILKEEEKIGFKEKYLEKKILTKHFYRFLILNIQKNNTAQRYRGV